MLNFSNIFRALYFRIETTAFLFNYSENSDKLGYLLLRQAVVHLFATVKIFKADAATRAAIV
jgi:hypothetical protein